MNISLTSKRCGESVIDFGILTKNLKFPNSITILRNIPGIPYYSLS